jgi:head-tail adaptor
MGIESLYNDVAIKQAYTLTEDDYGQPIKTWSVSTTIKGALQSRSGNKSIINDQNKASINDRFYCNEISLTVNDRLLFSTNIFFYQGTAANSSDLISTVTGSLYFITSGFSTYVVDDFARFNGTDYVIENFKYRNILYVNNNLRGHHLQIDLEEDYENKT